MTSIKGLILICLSVFFINCGSSGKAKSKFSIVTNAEKNILSLDETLELSLKNPEAEEVKSVIYKLDGKTISDNYLLIDEKLGIQELTATIQTKTFKNVHSRLLGCVDISI